MPTNAQVRGVSLTRTQAYSVLVPTSITDRLEYGDQVNRRLAGGCSRAKIAVADGVSTQLVSKAAWLARAYITEDRRRLGSAVLNTLTLSQLEVAAAVRPDLRADRRFLQVVGSLRIGEGHEKLSVVRLTSIGRTARYLGTAR